ncbi:hypothetical protein IAR50_000948 [Cryptococcus sp. DSM 104548]
MIPFIVQGVIAVWTAFTVLQMDIIHQNHLDIIGNAFFHPALPIIPILLVYSIAPPSVYKVPEIPSASFTSASSVSFGWPASPLPDGGVSNPYLTFTEDGKRINTAAPGPNALDSMIEQLTHLIGAALVSFLAVLGGMKRVLNKQITRATDDFKASIKACQRRYKVAREFLKTHKGELIHKMAFRYLVFFAALQPSSSTPTPEFGVHVPRPAPVRRALLWYPLVQDSLELKSMTRPRDYSDRWFLENSLGPLMSSPRLRLGSSATPTSVSPTQVETEDLQYTDRWYLENSLGPLVSPPRLRLGSSVALTVAVSTPVETDELFPTVSDGDTNVWSDVSVVLPDERGRESDLELRPSLHLDLPSVDLRTPGEMKLIRKAREKLERPPAKRTAEPDTAPRKRTHSTMADSTSTITSNDPLRQTTTTFTDRPLVRPASSSSGFISAPSTITHKSDNTELPSTGPRPQRPIGEGRHTQEEADSSTGPQPSRPIGGDSASSQMSPDNDLGPDPRHPIEAIAPSSPPPALDPLHGSVHGRVPPSPASDGDDNGNIDHTRNVDNNDNDNDHINNDNINNNDDNHNNEDTDSLGYPTSVGPPTTRARAEEDPPRMPTPSNPVPYPNGPSRQRIPGAWPIRPRDARPNAELARRTRPGHPYSAYGSRPARPISRAVNRRNPDSGRLASSHDRHNNDPRLPGDGRPRDRRLGPHNMELVQPVPVGNPIDELGERPPQGTILPSYERYDSNPAPPYFGYPAGQVDPDPPPGYQQQAPLRRTGMDGELARYLRNPPYRGDMGVIAENMPVDLQPDDPVSGWLQQQQDERAAGGMSVNVISRPDDNQYDTLPAPFLQGEPIAMPAHLQNSVVTQHQQSMNAGHVLPEHYAGRIVFEEAPPQAAPSPVENPSQPLAAAPPLQIAPQPLFAPPPPLHNPPQQLPAPPQLPVLLQPPAVPPILDLFIFTAGPQSGEPRLYRRPRSHQVRRRLPRGGRREYTLLFPRVRGTGVIPCKRRIVRDEGGGGKRARI